MTVHNVFYATSFLKGTRTLPAEVLDIFEKKEKIFRLNPLHPSLRLHQLHGALKCLWSISINKNYRAIFKRQQKDNKMAISCLFQ